MMKVASDKAKQEARATNSLMDNMAEEVGAKIEKYLKNFGAKIQIFENKEIERNTYLGSFEVLQTNQSGMRVG